jgi:hypothetical protein
VPSISKRLLACVALTSAMSGLSAGGSLAAAPATSAAGTATATTRLIYLVPNCEDCVLFLYGYDSDGGGWGTLGIDVDDGRAEVVIDTALTAGLVTLVKVPWEHGDPLTAGTPTVAMRYNGQAVGSSVTVQQARAKKRASGCWAGTSERRQRFRIVVRKVRAADGTATTLAFARQTRAWTKPMRAAPKGRLRTWSAEPCILPAP